MKVCPDCFDQIGLRRRIVDERPKQPRAACDFHSNRKGVPISVVARIVDGVFRERFVGGIPDDRYGLEPGSDLGDALTDLTGAIDTRIVDALITALDDQDSYWPGDGEMAFYCEEYRYVTNDHSLDSHGLLWRTFCSTLLYDERFFNARARDRIVQIFDKIHRQRDARGNPAIYMLRPDDPRSVLYRARIADDPKTRQDIHSDPAKALGTPPQERRRPGRLNPSGIAAFYGSMDPATCVAELRPAVGTVVCSARFQLLRPICVLDTTRFDAPAKALDPFSRDAMALTAQWRFMRNFMEEIAKPIRPDDEHREYIPTQAVAEYLSNHLTFHLGGEKRRIEAIIYRSAQAGRDGRNIVLLGRAAQVLEGHALTGEKYLDFDFYDPTEIHWEPPRFRAEPTLAVVQDSLAVHRVAASRFEVADYEGADALFEPLLAHPDHDDL